MGFTLLELLVVVSILAAVAFTSAFHMRNATEVAGDSLVRVEMQQIAQAIRRFKQDTGYYPTTGPFALDIVVGGEVDPDALDVWSAPSGLAEEWFYSPANLYQLVSSVSPLDPDDSQDGDEHVLAYWNPETGRGWRGPYMVGYEDGDLSLGDDINDSNIEDISSGDTIGFVPGVADPFDNWCFPRNATEHTVELGWVNPDGEVTQKWGSPYLVFSWTNQPYIVSMGPDGYFGSDAEDDILLDLE